MQAVTKQIFNDLQVALERQQTDLFKEVAKAIVTESVRSKKLTEAKIDETRQQLL